MKIMGIKNTSGMSPEEFLSVLEQGGQIKIFSYSLSLILVSLKRPSSPYLIRPEESAIKYHWKYTLLSLLLGWWGFPWGIFYTFQVLFENLKGGADITKEAINQFEIAVHNEQNSSEPEIAG